MKTITVTTRRVYGVEKIYPVCDYAKLFARIAGTETITEDKIALIKKLGFAVKLKQEPSPLQAAITEGV